MKDYNKYHKKCWYCLDYNEEEEAEMFQENSGSGLKEQVRNFLSRLASLVL